MSTLKVNEVTDLAGTIPDGVGRIVQIVRATDATDRTTTSSSYVDVAGLSVTITPTSATSNIIILMSGFVRVTQSSSSSTAAGDFVLTDSSNSFISGAEEMALAVTTDTLLQGSQFLIGFDSPATTSAKTYKVRFRRATTGSTIIFQNSRSTGQLYAIEVAA